MISQDDAPIVPAYRHGNKLLVHCPFCQAVHVHGLTGGFGNRAVHCAEPQNGRTSYTLIEASGAAPAGYVAAAARGLPMTAQADGSLVRRFRKPANDATLPPDCLESDSPGWISLQYLRTAAAEHPQATAQLTPIARIRMARLGFNRSGLTAVAKRLCVPVGKLAELIDIGDAAAFFAAGWTMRLCMDTNDIDGAIAMRCSIYKAALGRDFVAAQPTSAKPQMWNLACRELRI